MNLHVETQGSGTPLLLIHGWGMHGGMWGGVVEQLAEHFRVLAVDLPGHGYSRGQKTEDITNDLAGVVCQPNQMASSSIRGQKKKHVELLDGIVDSMSAQFSEPLIVCGWSLGGQIALRWAMRYPQQVNRLALVACTPCFVRRPGWECAMREEALAEFSASLQQGYASTLRRFLALQVRGSERERELLAELHNALSSRSEPDSGALQAGLEILRDCDLRGALPGIMQPALVIAGERDTLTPPQASHYLAAQMPNARSVTIKGAAHAPFLSHPDEFMRHMMSFLHE
ncbi:MAG: alpha/beta fold hydrolase [Nitrosomonadales bacterium]|nr:alpha/beta fold hydrolase [Nitrosomonadales bacterium]